MRPGEVIGVSAEAVTLVNGTGTPITPVYSISDPATATVVNGQVTAGPAQADTVLVATHAQDAVRYSGRIPLVIG
jgi:hypothetical protein